MWVLFARAPPPDAPYWPGRRWLAAVDAVAWPAFTWLSLNPIRDSGGLVVALLVATLPVWAARRLFVALRANHRYHFAVWRCGRTLAWLIAIGAILGLNLSH
jgi:hypothetical protein